MSSSTTKTCSVCKTEKSVSDFYTHGWRNGVQRISHRCKECDRAKQRARNRTEEGRAGKRAWSTSDKGRASNRQSKLKREGGLYKGVPMTHRLEDCPDNLCYWCGIETFTDVEHTHPQFRDLEHVMPIKLGGETKPYNETWACRECNRGADGKHSKHPLVWIAELLSRD